MEHFNVSRLNDSLTDLVPWKRVAFMAACCERMLPNYEAFQAEEGWGDASVLRAALAAVWAWIATSADVQDIAALVAGCEEQAPEPGEFASLYVSSALDAANSVAAVLEALDDASVERAIEVATLSRDSVDMFVQLAGNVDVNAPDGEDDILRDPLMQRELRHQAESTRWLAHYSGERTGVAAELRERHGQASLPRVHAA